ncbi:hypothetical protein LTR56_004597 [Elasticomyces elasticus]|nr:hypothetical protein LTR56_004597 [Elasticomyces elasticus]KAK3659883.1 hypothetical protein LTR22_008250 [Elasticomyces elasticus]KAK4925936.1 hypothetical protein LTR49_007074 [Elasticomyces elasticus]KAK5768173.1 hypothetical protein LTS12_001657 [Elasticomyces elasticus]
MANHANDATWNHLVAMRNFEILDRAMCVAHTRIGFMNGTEAGRVATTLLEYDDTPLAVRARALMILGDGRREGYLECAEEAVRLVEEAVADTSEGEEREQALKFLAQCRDVLGRAREAKNGELFDDLQMQRRLDRAMWLAFTTARPEISYEAELIAQVLLTREYFLGVGTDIRVRVVLNRESVESAYYWRERELLEPRLDDVLDGTEEQGQRCEEGNGRQIQVQRDIANGGATGTSFLDLPPELRLQVYGYLFASMGSGRIDACEDDIPAKKPFESFKARTQRRITAVPHDGDAWPGFMRSCSLVRHEAMPLYLSYLMQMRISFCRHAEVVQSVATRGRWERTEQTLVWKVDDESSRQEVEAVLTKAERVWETMVSSWRKGYVSQKLR